MIVSIGISSFAQFDRKQSKRSDLFFLSWRDPDPALCCRIPLAASQHQKRRENKEENIILLREEVSCPSLI
jgi:hypothetical protein